MRSIEKPGRESLVPHRAEESLARFQFDHIDLLLIHSPKPWPELFAGSPKTYYEENLEVWKAMIEAYSPNATGKLMDKPDIIAMAKKYGVFSSG